MKDIVTVWNEFGKKLKLRKYYLVMHLKEAYALFSLENSDINISLAKFTQLRPINVLLLKNQPFDQCKCEEHENFIYMLKGLNETYDENFWKKYICNSNNYESSCWKNVCIKCKNGTNFINLIKKEDNIKVNWKVWVRNDKNKLKIDIKEDYVGRLKEIISQKIVKFQEHVRIKRIQEKAFEFDKNNENTHVLQMDFAMAYSCE